MSTASGLKLKAYWQSKCEGAIPPLRSDLDPVEMKSYLPDLVIAETGDMTSFRIRLAGTRVTRRLGCDPTSKEIEPSSDGITGGIARLIERCHADGAPVADRVPYPDGVESFDAVNCTVLPIRNSDGIVGQYILALDFVFAATSLAKPSGTRTHR
jgi:hypothetical protein